MEMIADRILLLSVMALPFLLAVTLREAGRAFMAYKLGDVTQATSGRLSLNPLVHAHPIYTGVLPALSLIAGFPLLFGFAKPLVYQSAFFRHMRRDLALMAIVGPVTNLVLAILFSALVSVASGMDLPARDWLTANLYYGVAINCMFIVINLLPIPPLDGGKLLEQMLPYEFSQSFRAIEPYSFLILLAIIMFARNILWVPIFKLTQLVLGLFGTPI
ncbi:MAG: site-2 protease family protein [Alphaproteobacteria bacterium]|nr:MAG: site-2 protease family protein [Alphaproteobacteria bacterium]